MRIALFPDTFPPYISGLTTTCVMLAGELLKEGHEVMIFTPRQRAKIVPKGLEKAQIVYVTSVPTHVNRDFRLSLPNLPKVLLKVRKFNADILESQAPSPLGIDALMTSKILGIPSVTTFSTNLASKEYLQMIFKTKRVRYIQRAAWRYLKWFYSSQDHVFALTNGTKKILADHGIAKSKISASLTPFDFETLKILNDAQATHIKNKYDLGKKVAVFVGRLSPEKSLNTLIEIWDGVAKECPEATLLIIGGGPCEKELRQLVGTKGLSRCVKFTGMIENKELLSSGLLSACDVFVSTSTSETLGLSGLEAMASGLPVVLVKSQGLCEFVGDGGFVCKKGDYVRFRDAIIKIFKSEKLKKQMEGKARKIANNYGGRPAVQRYIKNLEKVIRHYKKSPLASILSMSTAFLGFPRPTGK